MRKAVILITMFVAVAYIAVGQVRSAAAPTEPSTLVVTLVAGVPAYEFDGKAVPKGQLMNVLGHRYDESGASAQLSVLVQTDVALTAIFQVQASVGKVGFAKVRFFCFDRERRAIWQLTFGQERPFTLQP